MSYGEKCNWLIAKRKRLWHVFCFSIYEYNKIKNDEALLLYHSTIPLL